jgi:hypothetical protein
MKENVQEFLILIILAAARTEFNVSDDAAKSLVSENISSPKRLQ